MATKLNMINLAIIMLGEQRLSSVSEQTRVDELANEFFDICFNTAISESDWTFARKRTVISPDTIIPEFGYTSRFMLPSDFNHICREATETALDYRIEGNYINYSGDSFSLLYIANITDYSFINARFAKSVSDLIAVNLSYVLTSDPRLATFYEQMYASDIQKAKGLDGSGVGLDPLLDDWIEDR